MFDRKNYAEAVNSLDQALQLAPNYTMALYYAGKANIEIRDFWGDAIHLTDYMRTPRFEKTEEIFNALSF